MKHLLRDNLTAYRILLLLILLVATINRFYGLDRLSLWADELWVVMASSKGTLSDMFSFIYYHDNHPPGHYLFTRYWQLLFGSSDFTIRFPFAISGVFLVYSTYVIGKKYYSTEAGLIAATLVSSSWQAIYYSQDARANIMVAVTALWSLHYFYRAIFAESETRWSDTVWFWVAATCTAYLHYAGTVFVACLGVLFIVVLLRRRGKSLLFTGLKFFVPVLLLFSPWLPGMFYRLNTPPPGAWWGVPEWSFLYENFKWLFGFGSRILGLYEISFVFLAFLCFLALLKDSAAHRWLGTTLSRTHVSVQTVINFSACVLVMMVLPVMIFFVKSRISQPVYDYRHFVYVLPLLALVTGFLLSLPLTWLTNTRRVPLLSALIVFLLLVQNYYNIRGNLYTGPHFKAEYRQTVDVIEQNAGKPDFASALIIANSDFFNHYLRRNLGNRSADSLITTSAQLETLHRLVKEKKSSAFYFLEVPETRERNLVSALDNKLAKTYQPVCRTRFIYAHVIRFDTTSATSVNWDQLPDCRK